MTLSRRDFLRNSFLTGAGLSFGFPAFSESVHANSSAGPCSVHIFSKNLHWLNYPDMAAAAAELGFDGVDITVRPQGHVLPERVADDLPRAIEAVKKVGLSVQMITTGITSADDIHTEAILKTAAAHGVSYYRLGWIEYDAERTMADNLAMFKTQMTGLADLNKRYKIHGDYQNHSGASFGSSVWDLWLVLKDLDPAWIGSQYDVMHATVEGANSWPLDLKLLKSYIGTLDIKDFVWQKNEKGWATSVVPLGQGMVDYKKYLTLLKEHNIRSPFSMHFEYPLGGAEHGARVLTMPRSEVFTAMKRDLILFKAMLTNAGLR